MCRGEPSKERSSSSLPPQINPKAFPRKNISLIFPSIQEAVIQTMTRLVFPTLGWQLQECNPAICSQGIFYSQLLEPSHRACRNAWMLLPADQGHKESVVWLRSMSCSRAKKKKKSMYWASIPIHASLCVYVCLCVCRSQHTCVYMSAYMLTLVSSLSIFLKCPPPF